MNNLKMLFIVFARRQRCARSKSLQHQEIRRSVFAVGTFDPGTVSAQSIGVAQGRNKVCFQLSYRYGRFVLDRRMQCFGHFVKHATSNRTRVVMKGVNSPNYRIQYLYNIYICVCIYME
jgi:hypothetical protein